MRERDTNVRRPRRPESATRVSASASASADRRSLEKCRRRDRRATGPCCCCRYRCTETSSRPCAGCRDERSTSPRIPEACPTVAVPWPRAGRRWTWTSRVSPTACRLGVPAHNLKASERYGEPEHRASLSEELLFAGKGSERNCTPPSELHIVYLRIG